MNTPGEPKELNEEVKAQLVRGANNCALANLRKTTRVITQLYDQALKGVELRGTQFTLLSAIAVSEIITINELAAKLVMDRTTLARDLKPLEERGLVTIQVGENDLRTRQLKLTTSGRQLLLKAIPLRQKAQEEVEKALGTQRLESLIALLGETTRLFR